MPRYDKQRIKTLCDKYIKTEDSDDFGELLMALKPMIWAIVRKWHSLFHHHQDMVQEIMMTLWKNQSNVNRLKLNRMKRNKYGKRYCMSVYFYFIIRGYVAMVAMRFERIYDKNIPRRVWFNAERWICNMDDVERYGRNGIYGESDLNMEKLMEME